MTKTELITAVSDRTGIAKKDVGSIIDATFSEITNSMAAGDKVRLVGFGTFETRDRGERQGRNPRTGKPMTIAAKKSPAFKAGKALKEAVN